MDYASRKFLFSLFVFIVGTAIFIWTGKLSSTEWLALSGITGTGYGVLNILESIFKPTTPEVKS
jgi:hypothetical protein